MLVLIKVPICNGGCNPFTEILETHTLLSTSVLKPKVASLLPLGGTELLVLLITIRILFLLQLVRVINNSHNNTSMVQAPISLHKTMLYFYSYMLCREQGVEVFSTGGAMGRYISYKRVGLYEIVFSQLRTCPEKK